MYGIWHSYAPWELERSSRYAPGCYSLSQRQRRKRRRWRNGRK